MKKHISSNKKPAERVIADCLLQGLKNPRATRGSFLFLLCCLWCIGFTLQLLILLAAAVPGIPSRWNNGQRKKRQQLPQHRSLSQKPCSRLPFFSLAWLVPLSPTLPTSAKGNGTSSGWLQLQSASAIVHGQDRDGGERYVVSMMT